MILERLEQLPVGSFQYKLLVVTGLGWLFDSMDTGLISFILPVLAKEWNLSPAQVGWIGSIGLIGMALGAVLAGTLADRIGRKKVFSITVLLYSLSTGMCALSWSYESLLFFRFLVGFGLGGEWGGGLGPRTALAGRAPGGEGAECGFARGQARPDQGFMHPGHCTRRGVIG